MLLKFKAEAFSLELVVAFNVELVQVGLSARCGPHCFVQLGEDVEVEHLLCEVASVELHIEYCLIEVLQFLHCELLRQKLKADRLEVYLLAEALQRNAQYAVVVECQLWYAVEVEPLR